MGIEEGGVMGHVGLKWARGGLSQGWKWGAERRNSGNSWELAMSQVEGLGWGVKMAQGGSVMA